MRAKQRTELRNVDEAINAGGTDRSADADGSRSTDDTYADIIRRLQYRTLFDSSSVPSPKHECVSLLRGRTNSNNGVCQGRVRVRQANNQRIRMVCA
eukprot:scaffold76778_cov60-Attheya_sp.AAC.2